MQQRLKQQHILLADKGTKYFRSLLKRENLKYSIGTFKKSDGTSTTSQQDIVNEFLGYYLNLLGIDSKTLPVESNIFSFGPLFSESDRNQLQSPTKDYIIKETLFSMGDDKSPRPDGFTAAFFKHNWVTICDDFLLAVHEFFLNGTLLKQVNHAAISLIPEGKHDPIAADFSLISCCNVVYKTISKVIVIKLALLLPKIINPSQAAFLEGRDMMENLFIAQQLMRSYSRTMTTPRCMAVVDFFKAFGTISWKFLTDTLYGLGVPKVMVKWIMQCVITTSYSISLNVALHGFFRGKIGIRQGDPLLPYLFIMAMEYLSRLITRNTAAPGFRYHPKCAQLKLTHLIFTDDVMLFSRGDTQSMEKIMSLLHQFSMVSDLVINVSKSATFVAGVNEADRISLLSLTGFTCGELPVCYLGVPLAPGKIKSSMFTSFIHKVARLINS